MSPPTSGRVSAESKPHSAKPAEIEARLQPNSASSGLMNTPNAKTLIGPFPAISAVAEPTGSSHGRLSAKRRLSGLSGDASLSIDKMPFPLRRGDHLVLLATERILPPV